MMVGAERLHVLLIGIDAYPPPNALHGCVNDIDKVHALLVGTDIGIDESRIRRLTSPHGNGADDPATYTNIHTALTGLGDTVGDGDRVFIYYSGHGYRRTIVKPHGTFHREALVPVDGAEGKLLYDYELNGLLERIAEKTNGSVAVVLDCCHSAGATRDPVNPRMVARAFDPKGFVREPAETRAAVVDGGRDWGTCHVVCACLDHESAYESPASDGERNGLFTRAFVGALQKLKTTLPLPTLSWSHFWQTVRDRVETDNAAQHVWMTGNPARLWLAGPPVEGDAGFAVTKTDDGYEVLAGSLAGVTERAAIGLYPQTPNYFPPIDSPDDKAARLATLDITSAERASARANGPAITLPPGVRGRLVKPGVAGKIRYAIVPHDAALADAIASSPLLEPTTDRDAADVRLEKTDAGWALTDDVHDVRAPLWPLFTFSGDPAVAREVLTHYARYIVPIQMANRALDLRDELVLSLRTCPAKDLNPAEAQVADLPLAPLRADGEFTLHPGARTVFHVENKSAATLRVSVVNCGATGKVQLLGDHVIDAKSAHYFWLPGTIGKPFVVSLPVGTKAGTDRVVAIARTALHRDLEFLRIDRTFRDIVEHTRSGTKDFGDGSPSSQPPPEKWAAHRIVVRTRST